ncbi:hypothetical protein PsorP6_000261 [Peronosclerospora sorghi]|uniref:Uncharacterized protein n=1 Tax=Peronosclerospora sorghi TaxID=230839 RepID=A0ACC0WVF2_9STRA|nr:hypothetical protein PsorP6_000261 [Peronosclerospora sorghi]
MPKKGLKTPFQRGHEAHFGLVVTERDEATSAVRAVTCQFCLKFGREAKHRAKGKRTSHAQSFTAPFRVDMYTQHHENAHPERWAEFQQLSPLSEEDIAGADLTVPHVCREEYMVAYADALIFIRDKGLFFIDSLEALPEPDIANIVNSIANLFAGLYSGIKGVLAVRGSENIGSSTPLPPFLPHSLIKIRTAVLSELLRQYTQRLQRASWTQVQIDRVEQDH